MISHGPGKSENKEGVAFSGPGGAETKRILESIQAPMRDILITNLVRCWGGPGPDGKGDRNPTRSEILACAPYLNYEVRLAKPILIIGVGRIAWVNTVKRGSKLHSGSMVESIYGIPLYLVHHPVWGLRKQGVTPRVIENEFSGALATYRRLCANNTETG